MLRVEQTRRKWHIRSRKNQDLDGDPSRYGNLILVTRNTSKGFFLFQEHSHDSRRGVYLHDGWIIGRVRRPEFTIANFWDIVPKSCATLCATSQAAKSGL